MKSLTLSELQELAVSTSKIKATEGKTDIIHLRMHIQREIERKEFISRNGKKSPQLVK